MKKSVRIIFVWILILLATFLLGCYDDGAIMLEEETLENNSFFYGESEPVILEMVMSLFDIKNCGWGISKADITRMCQKICNVVNYDLSRLRDVIHAMVNLNNIRIRIILDEAGEIKEGYAIWNDGVIMIKEKWVLDDPTITIHEMIHQLQFSWCGYDIHIASDCRRNIEFEAYLIMDISIAEFWLKQGAIPVADKLCFLYVERGSTLAMDYINYLCRVYERRIGKEEFKSEFNRFAKEFRAYESVKYSSDSTPSLIFNLWSLIWC